jgi:signal transduction histidine kinase
MTNPADRTTSASASIDAAEDAFALHDLRIRLRRFGPHRMLLVLDLVAIALIAATYLQLGPPELLFHGVFVILTIDAFLFGRRVCLTRIVAVSVALLGYVALPSLEAGIEPLDLTEWPLMFTIAILVAWMADRERSAVRHYAGLYREARDRLVTAQEEERRRLSRDLHDGIGQTLTALTLALDGATTAEADEATTTPDGPMSPAAQLRRARALATNALDDVRLVAERVRPPRLEARGLASALSEMALRCGTPVTLDLDAEVAAGLDPAFVLEIYRIAQEAIGNAVRHGAPSSIALRLDRTPRGLRLVISDDGTGFDPRQAAPRGLGLTGMRERAALMEGRLRIVSRPGHGARVELVVPLDHLRLASEPAAATDATLTAAAAAQAAAPPGQGPVA